MQDHFKYLHFESFSIAWITFDLDKIYPCTFLSKHSRTCFWGNLVFLLENVVPQGDMVGTTILCPPLTKSISTLVIIIKTQNTFHARHCLATVWRLVSHWIHYSYLVLVSSLILTLILTTTSSMYDKIIDLNFWKTSCTAILPKLCPIIDSWNFKIIGYEAGPGVNFQKMPSSEGV